MVDELINAFKSLPELAASAEWLVSTIGVTWTCVLIIFFPCLAFAWWLWVSSRRDRGWEMALGEKEKSLQRIANECRAWRSLYLQKVNGMTEDEVQRHFIENEFMNGAESRHALEKKNSDEELN